MTFTGQLGTTNSKLANIVLGYGALERPIARSGSGVRFRSRLAGTATYAVPRYQLINTTGPGSTGGGTLVLTFPGTVRGGDLIVVKIACFGGASTPALIDSGGNLYRRATTANRAGSVSELWYAWNVVGGTGFQITITGATEIWASANEWGGFGINDPLFAVGQIAGSFTFTLNAVPDTINPNAVAETVAATANIGGAVVTDTPVPPWVQDFNFGGFSGASYRRLVKTAGTQAATWSSSGGWGLGIAIFIDPADFAAMRANQELQSTISLDVAAMRWNQQVQATASLEFAELRLNQVVLTLVVPASACPDIPFIGTVVEGGDAPGPIVVSPPICDNPGSKPIITREAEGGDVPAASATAPEPCDAPGTKPVITRAV